MTAPTPLSPRVGYDIDPDAITGYRELAPYAGQTMIVVGCGRTHDPHVIPNWNFGHPRAIAAAGTFTFDISEDANPHRVADFWVADHTEDLPGGRFDMVFLENLPASVFNSSGRCLVLARTAHRLLRAGGVLVVRTGMGLATAGTPVHAALVQIFGAAHVVATADEWNMPTDLRATR